jgi:hypothetical protein
VLLLRNLKGRKWNGIGRLVLFFIFYFGHLSLEQLGMDLVLNFSLISSFMFIQFEDELRRYLPIYIDMLKEVDAMDNILEVLLF